MAEGRCGQRANEHDWENDCEGMARGQITDVSENLAITEIKMQNVPPSPQLLRPEKLFPTRRLPQSCHCTQASRNLELRLLIRMKYGCRDTPGPLGPAFKNTAAGVTCKYSIDVARIL